MRERADYNLRWYPNANCSPSIRSSRSNLLLCILYEFISMTSSFGFIVIRFICPDVDPVVVWVCISKPSSQGGSGRLGPFLNWRELWDIKRDGKTNNFLKLELDYVQPGSTWLPSNLSEWHPTRTQAVSIDPSNAHWSKQFLLTQAIPIDPSSSHWPKHFPPVVGLVKRIHPRSICNF